MMHKDITILRLLNKLKTSINFEGLEVVDYWDADMCAIGLKKYNRLIYISTYNFVDQGEVLYDYDLEVLDEQDEIGFKVVKQGRTVIESELVDAINKYLFD